MGHNTFWGNSLGVGLKEADVQSRGLMPLADQKYGSPRPAAGPRELLASPGAEPQETPLMTLVTPSAVWTSCVFGIHL